MITVNHFSGAVTSSRYIRQTWIPGSTPSRDFNGNPNRTVDSKYTILRMRIVLSRQQRIEFFRPRCVGIRCGVVVEVGPEYPLRGWLSNTPLTNSKRNNTGAAQLDAEAQADAEVRPGVTTEMVTVTCNFELNREFKFANEIQSSILILPLQSSTVTTSDHRLHQPKQQRVGVNRM